MRDFEGALERVVAGMQSRKVINDHEKRVVAYHEAGHALCSELLPSVEQVHKISIVPRGGALGYTLNLPEEDRYLKSREELIDYMVVLLGGRVAEQIVFDSITTGASGDLKKVYEISRQMVTEYAMGTSVVVAPPARRRLLGVRQHAPHRRRGAAGDHRPRLPPRARADRRRTATCSRRSPRACSSARSWSARTSRAIVDAHSRHAGRDRADRRPAADPALAQPRRSLSPAR